MTPQPNPMDLVFCPKCRQMIGRNDIHCRFCGSASKPADPTAEAPTATPAAKTLPSEVKNALVIGGGVAGGLVAGCLLIAALFFIGTNITCNNFAREMRKTQEARPIRRPTMKPPIVRRSPASPPPRRNEARGVTVFNGIQDNQGFFPNPDDVRLWQEKQQYRDHISLSDETRLVGAATGTSEVYRRQAVSAMGGNLPQSTGEQITANEPRVRRTGTESYYPPRRRSSSTFSRPRNSRGQFTSTGARSRMR